MQTHVGHIASIHETEAIVCTNDEDEVHLPKTQGNNSALYTVKTVKTEDSMDL